MKYMFLFLVAVVLAGLFLASAIFRPDDSFILMSQEEVDKLNGCLKDISENRNKQNE